MTAPVTTRAAQRIRPAKTRISQPARARGLSRENNRSGVMSKQLIASGAALRAVPLANTNSPDHFASQSVGQFVNDVALLPAAFRCLSYARRSTPNANQ